MLVKKERGHGFELQFPRMEGTGTCAKARAARLTENCKCRREIIVLISWNKNLCTFNTK